MNRREFLKTTTKAIGLGILALTLPETISSCSPSQEEIEKIPLASLSDIIKNPESYFQLDSQIKTKGFMEFESDKIVSYTTIILIPSGKVLIPYTVWHTTKSSIYKLHVSSDNNSPFIRAFATEGEINLTSTPPEPPDNTAINQDEFLVVGKVAQSKIEDSEQYFIDIAFAQKETTTPTPVK